MVEGSNLESMGPFRQRRCISNMRRGRLSPLAPVEPVFVVPDPRGIDGLGPADLWRPVGCHQVGVELARVLYQCQVPKGRANCVDSEIDRRRPCRNIACRIDRSDH